MGGDGELEMAGIWSAMAKFQMYSRNYLLTTLLGCKMWRHDEAMSWILQPSSTYGASRIDCLVDSIIILPALPTISSRLFRHTRKSV